MDLKQYLKNTIVLSTSTFFLTLPFTGDIENSMKASLAVTGIGGFTQMIYSNDVLDAFKPTNKDHKRHWRPRKSGYHNYSITRLDYSKSVQSRKIREDVFLIYRINGKNCDVLAKINKNALKNHIKRGQLVGFSRRRMCQNDFVSPRKWAFYNKFLVVGISWLNARRPVGSLSNNGNIKSVNVSSEELYNLLCLAYSSPLILFNEAYLAAVFCGNLTKPVKDIVRIDKAVNMALR